MSAVVTLDPRRGRGEPAAMPGAVGMSGDDGRSPSRPRLLWAIPGQLPAGEGLPRAGASPRSAPWTAGESRAVTGTPLAALDDADLIERARGAWGDNPDPEAFGVLYTRHAQAVFAFARGRVRDSAQAEDITSQTFLQALRALPRYQQRGVPPRHWLLVIAGNLVASQARAPLLLSLHAAGSASGRRRWSEGDCLEDLLDARAEAALSLWEWSEDVWPLLDTLPPAQQAVIRLCILQDHPLAEAAAQLGRSLGATRMLRFRALRQLRRRWACLA